MKRLTARSDRIAEISRRTGVDRFRILIVSIAAAVLLLIQVGEANAHCDTMDGPVVTDARKALESGDVTPVLKWVPEQHEIQIRTAFEKTVAVRVLAKEASELADTYFFETLVRIHRASEGAPYTGIQPAGTPVERIITEADRALAARSVADLSQHLGNALQSEIGRRFERTLSASGTKESSVTQGREFVEAYVEYTHFLERIHQALSTKTAHHPNH